MSKPLSADELLTCPPFVPAFSFSAHKWGLVLVEKLKEVAWSPGVYNKLIVEDNIKDTLCRIVRGHSAHLTDFDDFIQGKGRGLVFLLHGPPGCGKTMTAGEYAVEYPGPQDQSFRGLPSGVWKGKLLELTCRVKRVLQSPSRSHFTA
jgi:DNA polymerase III delta prime subunit